MAVIGICGTMYTDTTFEAILHKKTVKAFNFHELVKSTGFQPVSLSLKRR